MGFTIHIQKVQPEWSLPYRPVFFAFLSGAFGGFQNIVFKATGELVFKKHDEGSTNPWSTIHPYYHIALIALLATSQIANVNLGLKEYDAVLFLPLYNACFLVLSALHGMVCIYIYIYMGYIRGY